MSGEDAYKIYHQSLNVFERDEIKTFQMIYYFNPNLKRKHLSLSNDGETKVFNNGFDTEDGDYLYEAGDHINYRYEIIKKLGRGAFGVVLKCLDH